MQSVYSTALANGAKFWRIILLGLLTHPVSLCMYMLKFFSLLVQKEKKIQNESVNLEIWIFKELFIVFLHTCMFPACYLCQRTCGRRQCNWGTQWDVCKQNALCRFVSEMYIYMYIYSLIYINPSHHQQTRFDIRAILSSVKVVRIQTFSSSRLVA